MTSVVEQAGVEPIGDGAIGSRPRGWWGADFGPLIATVLALGASAGYLLTWARFVGAGLPAQAILTDLPEGYFIHAGVHSMALPCVLALAGWGVLASWITAPEGDWPRPALVACFAVALGGASFATASLIDGSPVGPRFFAALAIGCIVDAVAAAVAAFRLRHRSLGRRAAVTTALALCLFTTWAARVAAAGNGNAFPYAQTIVPVRCERVMKGIVPPGADASHCQVGGFLLDYGGDRILLAHLASGCPHPPPASPLLLVFPASTVEVLSVGGAAPEPRCKGRSAKRPSER